MVREEFNLEEYYLNIHLKETFCLILGSLIINNQLQMILQLSLRQFWTMKNPDRSYSLSSRWNDKIICE